MVGRATECTYEGFHRIFQYAYIGTEKEHYTAGEKYRTSDPFPGPESRGTRSSGKSEGRGGRRSRSDLS